MAMPGGASGSTGALWAVIPIFDEAPTIGHVVAGVVASCPAIVVDDGSADDGGARAAVAGATRVLRHDRRRGKAAALRTGFSEALRLGAERIATLDGDGQHDPTDLPSFLAAARRDPHALIVGDRLAPATGDRMPPARRLAVLAADRAVTGLVHVATRDTQCGYRVYPAALLRDLVPREQEFVIETELVIRAVRAGYGRRVGPGPAGLPRGPPQSIPYRGRRRPDRLVPRPRGLRPWLDRPGGHSGGSWARRGPRSPGRCDIHDGQRTMSPAWNASVRGSASVMRAWQ